MEENRHNYFAWIVSVLIIIAIAGYFTKGFTFNSKPSIAVVTDKLGTFLSSRYSDCTPGTVSGLSAVRVGNFDANTYEGYPVYGSYTVTCQNGNSKSNSSPTLAIASARRDFLGRVVLFVPTIAKNIESQLNDAAANYWKDHPIQINTK